MPTPLTGQTIAMTGCTGGLGRELCLQLAALGADLVMLDRNPQKSQALAAELRSAHPGLNITHIPTDLEDMAAVRAAAAALCAIKPDVFLHNAGAYNIPRHLCSTGYDNLFQINFLSPYYLIRELSAAHPAVKIVAVGSVAHTYSSIDPDDPDFRTRPGVAKPYGNAKRFLMLALHHHFRDRGTHLAIVHPGLTVTNITDHYPKALYALMKPVMQVIFMTPRQASRSILEGVFTPTPYGTWLGPRWFGIWGGPKLQTLPACLGPDGAVAGELAEALYGTL